jgi:two-component system response regulator FixJ
MAQTSDPVAGIRPQTLALPLSGEPTLTGIRPQPYAALRSGPVLVIDDDAAVRHSLKFALELEGLDVRLYPGGEEVLAQADLPVTGCLVVDYFMPAMTGVELVEGLRRRHVALPAILITARATPEVRERAVRAGFREVLEKPLEDGALVDSTRDALASAQTA